VTATDRSKRFRRSRNVVGAACLRALMGGAARRVIAHAELSEPCQDERLRVPPKVGNYLRNTQETS